MPAEYGVLNAYMAVANVLAGIGNWQYAQGIIVENRENKAFALLRICMLTSAVTALVSALIGAGIFLFPTETSRAERTWFLLLPMSTMLGGVTTACTAMANRRKKYRMMAVAPIVSIVVTVSGSIGMGFLNFGYVGLLLAYFAGQIVLCSLYASVYFALKDRPKSVSWRRMGMLARKHRNFAIFSTPSAFVGNFAMQLPIYALGIQAATEMIGLFGRARQLLSMPITLLGASIAQVFQQRASVEYATHGNCRQIFQKTFWSLVGLGVGPTVVLAIVAPLLFEIFLGPNWRAAGEVARVLAPMLLLRLVCSPLSTVFSITGAQHEDFQLSVLTTIMTVVAVSVPLVLGWEPIWIAITFSASYCLTYSIYLIRGYQLSRC